MDARLRTLIAVLACVYLGIGAMTRTAKLTPDGVHCRAAPVQTVAETPENKSCCEKETSEAKVRKPKPGDAAFLQCQCAEKKAASAHNGTKEHNLQAEAQTTCTEPTVFACQARALISGAAEPIPAEFQAGESRTEPPTTPPPKN